MISKTYVPKAIPFNWSSAHCPIEFTYDIPTEECVLYNHASEGYLSIWSGLFMDKDVPLIVGDLVYLTSGDYKGYHVVKKVLSYGYSGLVKTSVLFQTETLFTVSTGSTLFDVKYATPPVWNIYAGYQDSEVTPPNPFPYKFVSEFAPEGNSVGLITFNISGYIQSAMNELIPPVEGVLGEGVDYSLFMPYRITTPTAFDKIFFALNCGVDTETLNKLYIGTGKSLSAKEIEFACGASWNSYVVENEVQTIRKTN